MIENLSNLAQWQVRRRVGSKLRRILRIIPKIKSGPGNGLRFDAGSGSEHFLSGAYERPVQEAIASMVRSGDVCYDIGANLGFFSLLFSRFAGPGGSVYAFEPVPGNADAIERNARINGLENVKILRIALCQVDGTAELLLAHHVGGATLQSAGVPPDLAGSLMVHTASVDTLVRNQELPPPNIVKIDVEGAELDVLRGMERVLRNWAPAVIAEVDDQTAAGCEQKVSSCQTFLRGLGYHVELLPNSYPDGKWFVRHFAARTDPRCNLP